MIISPPGSGNVHKIGDSGPRMRRGRVQVAQAPEGTTVRSSA
jgi:hypothetical protein